MLVHPRRGWLAAHMSVSVTVAWISQCLAWLRPCQWSIQVSDLFSCATARSEQVKPRASLSSVLKKKNLHTRLELHNRQWKIINTQFPQQDQEAKESILLCK
jgi:hypothetical protein